MNIYSMVSLIIVLAALIGVYLFLQIQRRQGMKNRHSLQFIDPSVVRDFVQHSKKLDIFVNDFVVLDVRTPREFRHGHIRKSVNYNFLDPEFSPTVNRLDRERSYIVCAERDSRSVKAVEMLYELGFTDLYVMTGGMLEWKMSDFPLEKL